jgi:hypothetical protein
MGVLLDRIFVGPRDLRLNIRQPTFPAVAGWIAAGRATRPTSVARPLAVSPTTTSLGRLADAAGLVQGVEPVGRLLPQRGVAVGARR